MLARVRLWLYGIGIALLGVVGAYIAGRRQASEAAKVRDMRDDQRRHGDMNDADIGVGATDEQHVKWLRDFAERNER